MTMMPMQRVSQARTDQRVTEVMRQATHLLSQLNAARQSTELRLSETGRVDPIKSVTGRSSLENAIDRTESLIDEMRTLASEPLAAHERIPAIETSAEACRAMLRPAQPRGPSIERRGSTQPSLVLAQ